MGMDVTRRDFLMGSAGSCVTGVLSPWWGKDNEKSGDVNKALANMDAVPPVHIHSGVNRVGIMRVAGTPDPYGSIIVERPVVSWCGLKLGGTLRVPHLISTNGRLANLIWHAVNGCPIYLVHESETWRFRNFEDVVAGELHRLGKDTVHITDMELHFKEFTTLSRNFTDFQETLLHTPVASWPNGKQKL